MSWANSVLLPQRLTPVRTRAWELRNVRRAASCRSISGGGVIGTSGSRRVDISVLRNNTILSYYDVQFGFVNDPRSPDRLQIQSCLADRQAADTNPTMQKVLNYLEQNQDRFVRELCDYVRFPSVSAQPQHKDDLAACAAWIHQHCEG